MSLTAYSVPKAILRVDGTRIELYEGRDWWTERYISLSGKLKTRVKFANITLHDGDSLITEVRLEDLEEGPGRQPDGCVLRKFRHIGGFEDNTDYIIAGPGPEDYICVNNEGVHKLFQDGLFNLKRALSLVENKIWEELTETANCC